MSNPLAQDLDHILAYTENLWEELRGQKIFITGGTGFFGCWLLESFIWVNEYFELNSTVTVLTRHPNSFQQKVPHLASNRAVQILKGDIKSFKFPDGEYPFVIHAAAQIYAKNIKNHLEGFDTMARGTRHVLNFIRHCKAKKLLLISSGAVYRTQHTKITHLPEDFMEAPDPLVPTSSYGEGKRVAELLGMLYAKRYGFEVKIARGFAFIGPHMSLDDHFAVTSFIQDGIRGGPIKVNSNGKTYRSYLYASDLAIWLWKLLFKGASCRAYNVGSDQVISIEELAHAIATAFNPKLEVLMNIDFRKEEHVSASYYVPSIKRISSELNLYPTISLSEAIHKTIYWFSH